MRTTIPPKPEKKRSYACHRFLDKLTAEIVKGDEVRMLKEAKLPANQLSRWRKGSRIFLDYAWMIANRLGVSLDYLANDEVDRPEDARMSPGARLAAEIATAKKWSREQVMQILATNPPPETQPEQAELIPGEKFTPRSVGNSKRKPNRK